MSDAKQVIVGGVPILLKDEEARSSIGNLSNLNTTAKTNLVAAINEAAQSGGGSGTDPEAVKYTSQSLTAEQKAQARTNIGAADVINSIESVAVSVDNSSGSPEAEVGFTNQELSIDFYGLKGEPGVGFESVATPSTADGTAQVTLTNGDTITLDLNHQHTQYPKYVLCEDEAEYEAITTKDSGTLYLILEEEQS